MERQGLEGETRMAEKYSMEHVKEFSQKYKNWGKWGPSDQLGTLNYITPEKGRGGQAS
jgi:hypothetical protein